MHLCLLHFRYIVLIQGILGLAQGAVWNTWGPISDSAKLVYGWTDAEIANLAFAGNLVYALTAFPVCYVMDVLGLLNGQSSMSKKENHPYHALKEQLE